MFVSLFVDAFFEFQLGMRPGYMGSNPEGWRCVAVGDSGKSSANRICRQTRKHYHPAAYIYSVKRSK
jgi:hypothetical protein